MSITRPFGMPRAHLRFRAFPSCGRRERLRGRAVEARSRRRTRCARPTTLRAAGAERRLADVSARLPAVSRQRRRGDGPYASTFAEPRRRSAPTRRARSPATRSASSRIRDGAASLADRPWQSRQCPRSVTTLDGRADLGAGAAPRTFRPIGHRPRGHATGGRVRTTLRRLSRPRRCKGDGPLAAELTAAPADLVTAAYHFRSTLLGAAPLDTDVIGTSRAAWATRRWGGFHPRRLQTLEDLAGHLAPSRRMRSRRNRHRCRRAACRWNRPISSPNEAGRSTRAPAAPTVMARRGAGTDHPQPTLKDELRPPVRSRPISTNAGSAKPGARQPTYFAPWRAAWTARRCRAIDKAEPGSALGGLRVLRKLGRLPAALLPTSWRDRH